MPTISFDEQTSNGPSSNYFHSNHSSNGSGNDSSNKNRTIKAVTRYIDAQGKKAANLTKQQSQSMVNLSSNLSVEGEPVEESCSGDDRRQTVDQATPHRSHHHEKQLNHAPSAIRSIIESQYAVLQQENEPSQKTSLDVKKKKKQNKLKMNYLHQNNHDDILSGQISPRADQHAKAGYLFNAAGSHSADHAVCKAEHKSHHLHGDRKHKLHQQHQKLVSNLQSEFNKATAVSKTEKAMSDYLNLNTSNNTSNSSTNSTSTDGDLTAKLAAATQKQLANQQQQEAADKENAQCDVERDVERKSQQFNCLPSRAAFQNESNLGSTEQIQISSQMNQMRSLSIQAPDCPLERVQFYKWFSQNVRRGRKGIQNMDANKNFLNNNHSKYGGFMELVYKQELRDLIWLEIKAWMDQRSMIEHDAYLCQQRKKIPKTLEKLLKFTVNYQVLNDKNYQDRARGLEHTYFLKNNEYLKTNIIGEHPHKADSHPAPGEPAEPKSAIVEQFKLNENKLHRASSENVTISGNEVNDLKSYIDQDTLAASVAIKLTMNESANLGEKTQSNKNEKDYAVDSPNVEDDNCNCSETLSRLCQYCVDKETTALEQVNKILSEIDEIEQLYPCVKALAIDYPTYESEQFVSRIKSLYLYQNIIRDIREKTNLLAKLFHIHNREAAGWPNFYDHAAPVVEPFSYNTSSDCTPEIFNITNRDTASSHKKSAAAAASAKEDLYQGYSYKLNAPAIAPNTYVKQVHFNLGNEEKANESANTTPTLNGNSLTVNSQTSCLDSPDANMHNIINLNGPQSAEENKTSNPFFPRKVSIYRRFVDKALKHKGLRYIYHQLSHILRPLLYRVHAALKKPALLHFDPATTNYMQPPSSKLENCDLCHNTTTVDGKLCECVKNESRNFGKQNASTTNRPDPTNSAIPEDYSNELSEFGVWSVSYQQMGLPTFHRPFFFLLRVTIDVIHECLILRLEQQPEQPSSVVVGQLIRECKEVIKAGVQIKQLYINLAQIVLGEAGTELFEAQLDAFNDDLKTMLIIYLKYLETYMHCMTKQTSKSNSTLKQKGYLEQEWNFVRSFCPYIPGGEALAANKFCVLASDLLTSIGDYIQNGVDDAFRVFKESLGCANTDESSCRKGILSSCRSFKLVFQEANAKVCQATAFAKTLRKDLEIAAEYKVLTSVNDLLEKLKSTGHIRVIAPNCCNHLLFIPSYMHNDLTLIWQLLDMTCGGRSTPEFEHFESTPGYLLITALPNDCQWTGNQIYLEPTPEVILSLSHVEPNGVFFLVNNPSHLTNRCRQFSSLMMGNLKILKHQTSCNNAIANALTELKNEALKIQDKTANSLELIYKELDLNTVSNIDESEKNILQMRCLDVLHQGFKFTFEYEKALTRLITGDSRAKLAKQLIRFAFQWMTFVINKCEKGRGLRARWVTPGLQYLMVALEPQYVQVLNQNEFKLLKDEVDKFLSYVMGSKERSPRILQPQSTLNLQGPYSVLNAETINKPLASSLNFQRSQSVVNVKGMFGELHFLDKNTESSGYKGTRLEDWMSKKVSANGHMLQKKRNKFVNRLEAIESHANELDNSTVTPVSHKQQSNGDHHESQATIYGNENVSFIDSKFGSSLSRKLMKESDKAAGKMERMRAACKSLEDKRDNRLKETGTIGCVSDLVIQRASYQVSARKVNFPWQRGFKIGEGRFGKVYTCVNNLTGELIAMKEIHLQYNDNRAIKETIDEIMIFEGIKHPNLVKYFGVEIHRNELYIFMEYCNEGSLESAVQLKLPEQIVRKYTRQLLEAVDCLHTNSIIHQVGGLFL